MKKLAKYRIIRYKAGPKYQDEHYIIQSCNSLFLWLYDEPWQDEDSCTTMEEAEEILNRVINKTPKYDVVKECSHSS